MTSVISKHLTAVVAASLLTTLTACVDFDSDSSASNSSTSSDEQQIAAESVKDTPISAGGIKGPLAFADAKVYAFDPSFPELYDKTSPISSAISSQFAEIDGLFVPRNIRPYQR